MNLYHLEARAGDAENGDAKTWLVAARSASEARALVPPDQFIVSVEKRSPCRPGPPRLVGWMGPPAPLSPAVKR